MRDGGLGTLCHSCGFSCQLRVLKTFSGAGHLHSGDGVVWIWHPLLNLYVWLTSSSCYCSFPLAFGLTVRDGGLNTLCRSCGFACQQRVLKTFPRVGYLHSKDEVAWLCHPVVNLYVWLTFSSCYSSIPLALGLLVRDGGLSTLCHSCGFACQQRALKTFSGPGYLESDDGLGWLWHQLVNLHIWLTISSCYLSIPLGLGLMERDGGSNTLCHSCGLAFQQRVLKRFPGSGYLHSEDTSQSLWAWVW